MLRTVQTVPTVNLPHHGQQPQAHARKDHPTGGSPPEVGIAVPATPGRSGSGLLMYQQNQLSQSKQELAAADGAGPSVVPATPGRSGSGNLFPSAPARCRSSGTQDRYPSPDTGRLQASMGRSSGGDRMASPEPPQSLRRSGGGSSRQNQHSAALLTPAAVAIAASTPVLSGRGALGLSGAGGSSGNLGGSSGNLANLDPKAALRVGASTSSLNAPNTVSRSSLLAGSSLGHLITKVSGSLQEREQELRKQQAESREIEDLLSRSKEELQQLISVVSQLHELQQSASEVLPDVMHLGPERPRLRGKPPFFWQPSQEYAEEFEVAGDCGEVVTKTKDFEDQGWVIPVGGAWRIQRGGLYRWTIRVERKCPSRPQLQLGIHGMNHSQPWRLVTTSRCSWSRDDEPWQDRAGGDRLIDEGDFVHVEVDMRGVTAKCGIFALAINDEPFEQFFDDIPLNTPYPLIPVVSMGGDQSRVRLCPSY